MIKACQRPETRSATLPWATYALTIGRRTKYLKIVRSLPLCLRHRDSMTSLCRSLNSTWRQGHPWTLTRDRSFGRTNATQVWTFNAGRSKSMLSKGLPLSLKFHLFKLKTDRTAIGLLEGTRSLTITTRRATNLRRSKALTSIWRSSIKPTASGKRSN